MVRLTKIYTKTGDKGETSLANNERVSKMDSIIRAIGAVDEANSAIGMIDESYDLWINDIQNDLFDLGADLAGSKVIRISQMQIDKLENLIDKLNEDLPTLQSFILPKGDIHNARAIVRRAEREVWMAYELHGEVDDIDINIFCPQYLNRLSDFLFVLARHDSARTSEVLWRPMNADEI